MEAALELDAEPGRSETCLLLLGVPERHAVRMRYARAADLASTSTDVDVAWTRCTRPGQMLRSGVWDVTTCT